MSPIRSLVLGAILLAIGIPLAALLPDGAGYIGIGLGTAGGALFGTAASWMWINREEKIIKPPVLPRYSSEPPWSNGEELPS